MTATNTCLFIKPFAVDAKGRERQDKDIENVIKPAIEHAGLTLLNKSDEDGLVKDINFFLVRQVHEASFVVIDVNCYGSSEDAVLSPFLFYFMALSHSISNKTILITRSTDHLPPSLRKHHTLVYSSDEVQKFYKKFKQVVEEIQMGEDSWPDNPIQEYQREIKKKSTDANLVQAIATIELLRTTIESLTTELNDVKGRMTKLDQTATELATKAAQVDELKEQLKSQKSPPMISFRRVS